MPSGGSGPGSRQATTRRGAFAPAGIVERWHSEDGPADIGFTLGDDRRRLAHPRLRDAFLNMNIVREINRLLPATGPRFRVCDRGGMPNFVVALTEGEKVRLERERGWTFCDFLECGGGR